MKQSYIEDVKTRKLSSISKERGRGKKLSVSKPPKKSINAEAAKLEEEKIRRRALHGEVFQILVTLLMQDGPFLILRLYLIVQFSIASEIHIFFTCKNAIVSVLLVYRLLILTCKGEDEEIDWFREDAAYKLKNVQIAILSTHLEKKELHKFQVE